MFNAIVKMFLVVDANELCTSFHLQAAPFIRTAEREENGSEIVKWYLSDNLTSDSEDKKQLDIRVVKRQLLTKRNGKLTNIKITVLECPSFQEK